MVSNFLLKLYIIMLEVTMIDIRVIMLIGICQIFLSIYLVLRRKNKIATLTELATSFLLFGILSKFTLDINNIRWKVVFIILVEYFIIKVFLVFFMWAARVYSFYRVKKICSWRRKINKRKLKIIYN